jgi:hypothetical protein
MYVVCLAIQFATTPSTTPTNTFNGLSPLSAQGNDHYVSYVSLLFVTYKCYSWAIKNSDPPAINRNLLVSRNSSPAVLRWLMRWLEGYANCCPLSTKIENRISIYISPPNNKTILRSLHRETWHPRDCLLSILSALSSLVQHVLDQLDLVTHLRCFSHVTMWRNLQVAFYTVALAPPRIARTGRRGLFNTWQTKRNTFKARRLQDNLKPRAQGVGNKGYRRD